jgi:serine/threonine-protein kinase
LGKYRVSRLLGQGGMGAVYEARHVEIDRPVAIKVLLPRLSRDPAQAARFLNEARAAGSVQDPGIVQVHDCGQLPDGSAFLVMEFLHGQTLGERMQAGPLPGGGLRIFHQAAAVLALVHARGIVHRDLKPDNLMLIPDSAMPGGERVKVLDFGIAKLAVERFGSVARRAATGDGAMMGTPLYMAPEQCHDAARATDRADVYSLGIMLYQAQSGAAPIPAGNLLELISFHVRKERPRPLREVAPAAPPALAALVGRMLSPEPAERPAMAEVRDTLEALLLPARPIQDQTPPPPDRRKVILAAGAAAAAGLLLLLGARLLSPGPSAGATGRDLGAPETGAARSAPREKPNTTTPAPSPASGPASATGDVPLIVSEPARPAPTPVTEDVPLIIGR